MRLLHRICLCAVTVGALTRQSQSAGDADWRDIRTGHVIPDEGYCDQPYVVVTKQGHWLCVLTTGKGIEGQKGQHVVATISHDHGRTWSSLIDIESADAPESSWAMPLLTPGGRVYVFYDFNGDRIASLNGKPIRTDMLGWYVYRYSDDGGLSWSSQRHRLPVRVTACDRANDWGGRVQILWGIGKPISFGGRAMFGFTKLGRYMLENGEGWFFRSDNILTETDPSRIEWTMLPDGDHGVRAPEFGSIQEEHNIVALSDGSLYCIYRTTEGYPCHSYSRDGGRSWSRPEPASYTPGGRRIKHPRACPRVWKTSNGKYLLWFHNHSGRDFNDRNPAWLCGGIERDGFIHWSEPEILLYDPDPETRVSYPDLIEQDGRYWITETQKSVARVHEIDATLLEALWRQHEPPTSSVRQGLIWKMSDESDPSTSVAIPPLPNLGAGGGFSIDLWLTPVDLSPGQAILDTRTSGGRGIALATAPDGALRIQLSDGVTSAAWDCDPGLITPNRRHHLVVTVDGGPRIITFVVDGRLGDGGPHRQFGWGRFPDSLSDINGTRGIRVQPSFNGIIHSVKIYNRALRTSEAVANYRWGNRK